MNALEIRGLCKQYPAFSLRELNLTLPAGCIMGLVGENGAGKSTTIRLILDMLRPDAGTVSIYGQPVRGASPALREEIGAVLDEVGFPECLNTVQIGKIMRGSFRSWDDGLYAQLLHRLAIPGDKPFKAYSRGMKMKLGIAVALSHHPRLLLLDEATSGLDPVVRDEVLEIFSEFTRDETHAILISSHIVSDLEKLCDYIAFLHKGTLLVCEEKDRLLSDYGMVRCSAQDFAALPAQAVLGRRESAYGVQAAVRRDALPAGVEAGQVDLEELFVMMVKGGGEQ